MVGVVGVLRVLQAVKIIPCDKTDEKPAGTNLSCGDD